MSSPAAQNTAPTVADSALHAPGQPTRAPVAGTAFGAVRVILLFAARLDDERWSLPWALHAAGRDARTGVGGWLERRLTDDLCESDPSAEQVREVVAALSEASVAGGNDANGLLAAAALLGTHAHRLAEPGAQMAARRELVPALVALAAVTHVPAPSPLAAVLAAACMELLSDPDPRQRGLAAAVERVPQVLARASWTADVEAGAEVARYTAVLSALLDERASMQAEVYRAWDMLADPTAAVCLALLANHSRNAQRVPPAAVRTWVRAHTEPVLRALGSPER